MVKVILERHPNLLEPEFPGILSPIERALRLAWRFHLVCYEAEISFMWNEDGEVKRKARETVPLMARRRGGEENLGNIISFENFTITRNIVGTISYSDVMTRPTLYCC